MGGEEKGLSLSPNFVPDNNTIAKQRKRASGPEPFCEPEYKNQNRINLDPGYLFDTPGDPEPITRHRFKSMLGNAEEAYLQLQKGQGDCLDKDIPMLGWMTLPEKISADHIDNIKDAAKAFRDRIDAFVSLGIGGSYLGIEATIKALTHTWFNQLSRQQRGGAPQIYFLGQNMDPDFFRDTLDALSGQRLGVNVISKSGTTTETAIAFRILRTLLENDRGADAASLIVATTDREKGALRHLANEKGYQTFVVPEDVGGRFSVLTDVGLFGIAVAGIDIAELIAGAADCKARCESAMPEENPALLHAAARTCAHENGKKIEVVATNSAALYQVARFMEQLFPESEGHNGQGLWVSPAMYSEKLHANGQMVQQGQRNILETFLKLQNHDSVMPIPHDPNNLDGLNYLTDVGRDMNFINALVVEGPAYAHYKGGVPNMTLTVPHRNAYCLGQLYYMLELSVAVSGYLLGHNPFVQPGVEDYKKAMFALAGKPGYESEGARMKKEMDGIKKQED